MVQFNKYRPQFSEKGFWRKVLNFAQKAGLKTIYTSLLLLFAFKEYDTPIWAKNIIIGVLGYFISPFDGLPDFTPLLGYTDDLGVLAFGLMTISMYINDRVREKARKELNRWFGNADEAVLAEVDARV